MCGIAGIFDLKGELNLRTRITHMLDTMRSRGPDDQGKYIADFWAIGMQRLAIVDLLNGGQPQVNEREKIFVVHNGEIYNHKDLRSQLVAKGYKFKTVSDTEVILHGYEEWGIDRLLDKIEGMFAFAIVDNISFVVHLARDRFGEKPLYINKSNQSFSFASDLRALLKANNLSPNIDFLSLRRYLALHYIPGNRSIWRGYEKLLPGERAELNLKNFSFNKLIYYEIPTKAENSFEIDKLDDLVEYAVRSRLMGDVPVGIFLSGGLDSSIITSFAARNFSKIETFSIGFDSNQYDESFYAREVAQNCGVKHHTVSFKEDDFREQLSFVAQRIDEPLGDPAALPTSQLSRSARSFVKVVLTGEGADEIFGGYDYYRGQLGSKNLFRKLFSKESITSYSQLLDPVSLKTPSGFPLVSDMSMWESLSGYRFNENVKNDCWEESFLANVNHVDDPLRKASIADMLTWLPSNLLTKLDRMTMLHSIEGRCPFLMKNLAEYAIALPTTTKLDGIRDKKALRDIGEKYLPMNISKRKKQGFILPMQDWLSNYLRDFGGSKKYVEHINCSFLDESSLIKIIDDCLFIGVERVRLLYSIIMLLEWSYNN